MDEHDAEHAPARPRLDAILAEHRNDPALDVGVSHAVLQAVDEGVRPATLRLFRPARILAFGRRDASHPAFDAACAAARDHGFTPLVRIAGGRAAVFTPGTLAVSVAEPSDDPQAGTTRRFEAMASRLTRALALVGVDVATGELEGEYCPGAFSLHAGGTKLAGIGQRVVQRAAHTAAVVVVQDEDAIRDVLVDVHAALELPLDPATVGSVAGRVRHVTVEDVRDAVVEVLAEDHELVAANVDDDLLTRARALAPGHVVHDAIDLTPAER